MKTIPCPTCQKPVDLTEKTTFRPFCSERCRLIDLGGWAAEDYQISGPSLTESDLLSDEEIAEDWHNPGLH